MSSVVAADLVRFGPVRCDRLVNGDALDYVRSFARRHRENFHVVSHVLPRRLRLDFAAIYAFCRWSDDLADEAGGPEESVPLLAWWERELRECFEGRTRHPVFVALRETVCRHDLPLEPFLDLLSAFRQDQVVVRYATWDDLLDYCRRSANPVGRLVLMLCGFRDARRFELADRTCTALQLANFWQDVRRDLLAHNRVYVPADVAGRHTLDIDHWAEAVCRHAAPAGPDPAATSHGSGPTSERSNSGPGTKDPDPAVRPSRASSPSDCGRPSAGGDGPCPATRAAFRATLRELTDRTQALFDEGRALLPLLAADVRPAIRLFTLGGEAVLHGVRRHGYETWAGPPRVGRITRAALLGRAWLASKGVPV